MTAFLLKLFLHIPTTDFFVQRTSKRKTASFLHITRSVSADGPTTDGGIHSVMTETHASEKCIFIPQRKKLKNRRTKNGKY